jgi:hypothetical protein
MPSEKKKITNKKKGRKKCSNWGGKKQGAA